MGLSFRTWLVQPPVQMRLPHVTVPGHKQCNVVYAVHCQEECKELYIGEAKQPSPQKNGTSHMCHLFRSGLRSPLTLKEARAVWGQPSMEVWVLAKGDRWFEGLRWPQGSCSQALSAASSELKKLSKRSVFKREETVDKEKYPGQRWPGWWFRLSTGKFLTWVTDQNCPPPPDQARGQHHTHLVKMFWVMSDDHYDDYHRLLRKRYRIKYSWKW